jgi:CRP/FNR family cyclic AMP-dependent transcriptional regulator
MLDSLMDQLSVFQGFSPEQFALLRPLFTFFFIPAGTVLFEQGDPTEFFYILIGGEIAIRYKPDDGPALVIARLRSEGVIGWSAAIGSPYYTSSAVCSMDSTVLRVRSANLRKFYETNPDIGAIFLERLAALIEVRLRSNHPQLMALLEERLSVKLDQSVPAG